MGRVGPSPKNKFLKIFFSKICDFPQIFYCILKYWFVFLYCKDTNPVLKYLVFVKNKIIKIKIKIKIKCFVFMHTAKSLKNNNNKNHIVFLYNKENFKNIY